MRRAVVGVLPLAVEIALLPEQRRILERWKRAFERVGRDGGLLRGRQPGVAADLKL
jgi:hypothetical protein